MDTETSGSIKSDADRKQALAQAIQVEVVHGCRVELQQDFQAVLVWGQKVNHILHLLITLFSCGAWGLVWLVLAWSGGEKRMVVSVDEYGNILRQRV